MPQPTTAEVDPLDPLRKVRQRRAELQVEQVGEGKCPCGEFACRSPVDPDQSRVGEGTGSERGLHARVVGYGGGYGRSDDRELLAVEPDLLYDVDAEGCGVAGVWPRPSTITPAVLLPRPRVAQATG